MLFNQHLHPKNALLFRAFLFSALLFSAIFPAASRAEVDMSSPDLQSLAQSTQLLVATNSALRADNIHVQVYYGYPDMAQVEAVNRHFQSGDALPSYAPDSFLGFVFSKPAINDNIVSIHALYVLDAQGKPTNEVWLKLKSPASLLKNFSKNDGKNLAAAEINVQQLQQAVFDQLKISATNIEATAALIKQGPVWLYTPIERSINNGKTVLSLPIVETPVDVAERFAGHFYIKLLTAFKPAN
jgi:hypothetical protein